MKRCKSVVALLQLLWMSVVSAALCPSPSVSFRPVAGADCVSSKFVRSVWGACGKAACGLQCARIPQCQAFTLTDGGCQCKLFVFDACSHRVQSVSNCTNQVTVYVRRLPGIEFGRLCPPGYGWTRFGTSYKLVTSPTVNWVVANQSCSAEAGLSKFADALDFDEAHYLVWLKNVTGNVNIFLGGHQIPGSASMNAGWIWDACNLNITTDVWEPGRPNNGLPSQGCVNVASGHTTGIDDVECGSSNKYLCECQSVF